MRGTMTVGEIYRTLSQVGWWADQPHKMRVLAARYYAGVDTPRQLEEMANPQICIEG
jgi:hypothetical protein